MCDWAILEPGLRYEPVLTVRPSAALMIDFLNATIGLPLLAS